MIRRNQNKTCQYTRKKLLKASLKNSLKKALVLNQEFTKDNTKTIRQYLQWIDKDLTVTRFYGTP